MCSEENLKAMFTRVQKKKMLNRTKLHLSVTKANTYLLYTISWANLIKKKKVYLSTVILKGKLMFFLTRL